MIGRLRIRHSSCKSKLLFCGSVQSRAHFHRTFGKRTPRFFPVVQSNSWPMAEQLGSQAPNVDRSHRENDYLFQSASSKRCNVYSSSDHLRKKNDVCRAACLRALYQPYLTFLARAGRKCRLDRLEAYPTPMSLGFPDSGRRLIFSPVPFGLVLRQSPANHVARPADISDTSWRTNLGCCT